MKKTTLNRREFLKLSSASLAAGVLLPRSLSQQIFSTAKPDFPADVLICIFLRGGLDGLNAVVPYFEDAYYHNRPALAVQAERALVLDDRFGLHPALQPLLDIWHAGELAVVHAVGSPDPSHSHFEAQDYMERGVPGDKSVTDGWIGRHLESAPWVNPSLFRALGMGAAVPSSLRGKEPVVAMRSIAGFQLVGDPENAALVRELVSDLYHGDGLLAQTARDTFNALDVLSTVDVDSYSPAGGAVYPESPFASELNQVAQMMRAQIGLEAVCLDLGGFDTHAGQGGADGDLADLLAEFAAALAAFYQDLRAAGQAFTVVVMSEFGRRLAENASGGTDHGHGGVMFALGPAVLGEKVHTEWPGLEADSLYGPGDLAVTIDFRDVLGELLVKRLGNPDGLEVVFPGHQPVFPGVFRA